MIYVAVDSATAISGALVQGAGLLRNAAVGDLSRWLHVGHYTSTLSAQNGGIGDRKSVV